MNQVSESFWYFTYGSLVPVMIAVAVLIAWLDKRFGSKQRDPVKTALARLKYASLIAAIAMFWLLIRLPDGVHIGSGNATEEMVRHLDRILQTVSIGLLVSSVWFMALFGVLREFSAAYGLKGVVPNPAKEHV